MYVPRHFQQHDWPAIKRVIDENSFATLVSCHAGTPIATHLPMRLVEAAPGSWRLQGHVSRANPHWRQFDQEQKSLAIFAGPHSYVSPRWYAQVNVPTWNYISVHVYGKPRVVSDPGDLYELMKGLVDKFEGHMEAERRYTLESLPAEFLESQLKGIVAFEIAVEEVQASFKLSQNRDQRDHDNVIVELGKSGDQDAHRVAQAMSCPYAEGSKHV